MTKKEKKSNPNSWKALKKATQEARKKGAKVDRRSDVPLVSPAVTYSAATLAAYQGAKWHWTKGQWQHARPRR
jgi:hypothetical protein